MISSSSTLSTDNEMTTRAVSLPMTGPLRRYAPLAILGAVMAAAYGLGLHQYLTLASIAEHRAELKDFVGNHLAAAILAYSAIYIIVVALSLPGAAVLSIFGGLLFGWMISAPVTIIAATIGAVIVFEVVKTSLGAVIAEKAGPFVARLSGGFREDAFNYLLFLRLVPAFPFFAVNAVAGLAGISRKTFTVATLIGIIPGSFAFAYLGRGLDSLIDGQTALYQDCLAKAGADCMLKLSPGALVTREILIAFAALGVVALVPVALRRLKRKA
jgi:uncharacterized membrane protein YdjX (TVP38/TMEM64 family)